MDAAGRYPVPDPLWRREPPAEFDCEPRSNVNCKPVPHATGSRCRTARGGGAGPCFVRRGALAPAAAVRRAARRSAACQSGRCCQSTALWFHGTVVPRHCGSTALCPRHCGWRRLWGRAARIVIGPGSRGRLCECVRMLNQAYLTGPPPRGRLAQLAPSSEVTDPDRMDCCRVGKP